jgi:hypothetical protein
MKSASRLFAAFMIVSSVSAVYAQKPAERPATPSPQATPGAPVMGSGMQASMQKNAGTDGQNTFHD